MPECRCDTRNFSGQEKEFVELGHFDKHFIKNTIRVFPKSENFFLPSCAPVSVAEYASIKWLNKLFWLCQGSEYTFLSYMIGRLLKIPPVLNKPGFWVWHGCICKGYAEFQIFLIMAPYASITPEYAWICLNFPQYTWTWLNIPECPWMHEYPGTCLNKLFRLCQGSKYAAIRILVCYNFIFFQHKLKYKNNESY